MYLALEQEAPDQETYAALAASHRSILEQFAPIGREMVKHCALGE